MLTPESWQLPPLCLGRGLGRGLGRPGLQFERCILMFGRRERERETHPELGGMEGDGWASGRGPDDGEGFPAVTTLRQRTNSVGLR